MNAPTEISIREAFSPSDMSAKSPSLVFTGTRGAMAAYLIEKDSAHWDCLDYFIFDNGSASGRDEDTRHWYVWRR
ncbi:MAG: hypothetical protein L0Z50_31700 [Verrucomicrobiales bacterium]|nr:hypothetical protein [Verrucomicrobiales bacterium]